VALTSKYVAKRNNKDGAVAHDAQENMPELFRAKAVSLKFPGTRNHGAVKPVLCQNVIAHQSLKRQIKKWSNNNYDVFHALNLPRKIDHLSINNYVVVNEKNSYSALYLLR